MYYILYVNSEGFVTLKLQTKEQLLADLDADLYGDIPILEITTDLPQMPLTPAVYIIKGTSVLPFEKTTVTEWDII